MAPLGQNELIYVSSIVPADDLVMHGARALASMILAIFNWNIPETMQWCLTHWGRVTHICVGKITIIVSNNGLLTERRQAIIWTNAGILLIVPLGTNFSDIITGIQTFSFKKMHLKMLSAKWRPFCLGLNVLMTMARERDVTVIGWWPDDKMPISLPESHMRR